MADIDERFLPRIMAALSRPVTAPSVNRVRMSTQNHIVL